MLSLAMPLTPPDYPPPSQQIPVTCLLHLLFLLIFPLYPSFYNTVSFHSISLCIVARFFFSFHLTVIYLLACIFQSLHFLFFILGHSFKVYNCLQKNLSLDLGNLQLVNELLLCIFPPSRDVDKLSSLHCCQ